MLLCKRHAYLLSVEIVTYIRLPVGSIIAAVGGQELGEGVRLKLVLGRVTQGSKLGYRAFKSNLQAEPRN